MDQRCETCRHFTLSDMPARWREGWDVEPYGHCEMTVNHSDEGLSHPESLAQAQDEEGYSAWLKVRPNFGCVQWSS